MALDIKSYLMEKLVDPLRYYNTSTQEVILEIVSRRLQTLYDTTDNFTDIIDIDRVTEYLLTDVAKSFAHDLDITQPVHQQRGIIDHLVETYRRRGSIDSIENMWKYYGGNLPKDVKVSIPAYDLFRYSISPYSGTHKFKDGKYWRSGVFDVLIRDDFDLDTVRDFLNEELVAGGVRVLFSRQDYIGGDNELGTVYIGTFTPRDMDVTLMIDIRMATMRSGMQYSAGEGLLDGRLLMSGRQTLFTNTSIIVEGLAPMTRKKEESAFLLKPKEVYEYFERPEVVPINLLSGFPIRGSLVYHEDPETAIGLDSAIGAYRSYDYMYPARILIWDVYPQRYSTHGKLGGKNSLSGSPVTDPDDKSWKDRILLPTTIEKLYERGQDKTKIIPNVDMDLALNVDIVQTRIQELEIAHLYGSDSTPQDIKTDIRINLYDVNDNLVNTVPVGSYPGYFVAGVTPVGGYPLKDQSYVETDPGFGQTDPEPVNLWRWPTVRTKEYSGQFDPNNRIFLKKGTYTLSSEVIVGATSWRYAKKFQKLDGTYILDTVQPYTHVVSNIPNYANPSGSFYSWNSNATHIVETITVDQDCYMEWFLSHGDTTLATYAPKAMVNRGATKLPYVPGVLY